MTSSKSLELLKKALLEVGPNGFIFARYKCDKDGRLNLSGIADKNGIPLEDDKITRYLIYGDSMKLSKLMEERCPKLVKNASFEEVESALEFVLKNYKKL